MSDTTEIDKEIAMLKSMRGTVELGWLEVYRAEEDNRLVFRLTEEGRRHVQAMPGHEWKA